MYYTGIGTKGSPIGTNDIISDTAARLRRMGFILRTGRYDGAWEAFSAGVEDKFESYSPEDATTLSLNLAKTSKSVSGPKYWASLPQNRKNGYARDIMLLLGRNCITPSKFLLCWTPNGTESAIHCTGLNGITGYVGFFIQFARANKIPVINLKRSTWEAKLDKVLSKIEKAGIG
jgi:hypothetical protein